MILAESVVVPQMEGVTTAIVLFVFYCVINPTLVKNRTQFYAAFVALLVIILLHSLNIMLGRESAGFQVFAGAITGLLQLGAIVLLFLGCGGITFKEFTGDLARAYEVIRRGEEEKTVIVPLTGEMPKPRQQPAPQPGPAGGSDDIDINNLDLPPAGGWPKKPDNPPNSSIPLE